MERYVSINVRNVNEIHESAKDEVIYARVAYNEVVGSVGVYIEEVASSGGKVDIKEIYYGVTCAVVDADVSSN